MLNTRVNKLGSILGDILGNFGHFSNSFLVTLTSVSAAAPFQRFRLRAQTFILIIFEKNFARKVRWFANKNFSYGCEELYVGPQTAAKEQKLNEESMHK
jgi:hypothetical protein